MGKLESPNQFGDKGSVGGGGSPSGGKIQSPREVGDKGNKGPAGDGQPGQKLVSPAKATNSSEAKGHDNGR